MVSLRREVKSNDDVYGGYRVRFGANQNTYGFNPDNDDYDSYPTHYGDSVAINQNRERFYPSERSNEKSGRMSGKGKFLIALYVVIVALFIGLIIANSSTITSAKETVTAKQALSEQEKAYTVAGKDMSVVYGGNMLQDGNSNGVTVGDYDYLEEGAPTVYTIKTNLFDSFCDGIGG